MAESNPDLVARAVAGDRAATTALVALVRPVIQARVARALLRRSGQRAGRELRQDVDDLVQEVLLGLFASDAKALRDWDPSRGLGLLGYVGLIADRDVVSVMRSRRRNPWTEEPSPDSSLELTLGGDDGPALAAENRELLGRVLQALEKKLTARGRQLFQLLVVEEQPVEEICRAFEMTPDSLYAWKSRMARAARAIGNELASGPDSSPRSTTV